jgi:hypothetical protein
MMRRIETELASVSAPAPVATSVVGREAELELVIRGLEESRVNAIVGLPGAGKTALALRAAQATSRPLVRHDARGGALAEPRVVLRALDEHGALLLVDDVQLLAPGERAALLTAADGLSRGRLLLTSTELLPRCGPDRVEVRLRGLDDQAARRLWAHLDESQGAAVGFRDALARSHGYPGPLRRAHAGLPTAPPAAAALERLGQEELDLVALLDAAPAALPRVALLGLACAAVLDGLVTRLLAVVTGVDRVAIAPEVRGCLRPAPAELVALANALLPT